MTMLGLSEWRPSTEPTASTGERKMDKSMRNVREIAFIDPTVVDIPALVAGLRPEVVPVPLGGELPAAQVIARTLRDTEAREAITLVPHGRQGDLSFATGDLSLPNIHQ